LVLPFTIPLGRTQATTNYSFGYSIKQITYAITDYKLNYTVEAGTKSASSVSMMLYTGNANKISNFVILYSMIEPLFNINDFKTFWFKPTSCLWTSLQCHLGCVGSSKILLKPVGLIL
jgi:hypothetical protein